MARNTPLVLVHGNPESSAIWGPMLARLEHPRAVCLCPPGFGAPLPPDFEPTVDGYRSWLVGQLELFTVPVDLVGHDWGGAHVFGVAMTRPDLVRCWASDALGAFAPGYRWHPLAAIWQTPGDGEEWVSTVTNAPLTARVEMLAQLGLTGPVAEALAAAINSDMGRAIISLYRSARQPAMEILGSGAPTASARPGLALHPTNDDMAAPPQMVRTVAEACRARYLPLEGLGHWWMVEDTLQAADSIRTFLTDVDRTVGEGR